jgi:hypothetical protein
MAHTDVRNDRRDLVIACDPWGTKEFIMTINKDMTVGDIDLTALKIIQHDFLKEISFEERLKFLIEHVIRAIDNGTFDTFDKLCVHGNSVICRFLLGIDVEFIDILKATLLYGALYQVQTETKYFDKLSDEHKANIEKLVKNVSKIEALIPA